MVIAAKESDKVKDKYDDSWVLMYNKYAICDSYDIYTQNKTFYRAKQIRDKLGEANVQCILWAIACFILTFFGLVINYSSESGLNSPILLSFIIAFTIILCLLIIASIILYHIYKKYDMIAKSYFESEEFKEDLKTIEKLEELAYKKKYEKKASNLILIYEALNNKQLSKQDKIKIIGEYINN